MMTNPLALEVPDLEITLAQDHLVAFAKATGQTDSIYLQSEDAKRAGYVDVVAAPTYLFGLVQLGGPSRSTLVLLDLDLGRVLHGAQRFSYERDVCAGETVTIRTSITDHYLKRDGTLEFFHETTQVLSESRQVAEMEKIIIVRHEVGE